MNRLGATFSRNELDESLRRAAHETQRHNEDVKRAIECLDWLVNSNYELNFSLSTPLSQRVIFPVSLNESHGMEDARFVRFIDEDGDATYYATYTAYDGRAILPQLIETSDFLSFRIRTLTGPAIQNKGMALFPKPIDGRYAMLSRYDDENLYLMLSDDLYFWSDPQLLVRPARPWEFVKIGNCGSPIETDAGWLVLTHGVGPMRKYALGAFLLDLDDPSRVIGRLDVPLLQPDANEREGYVPNVVYSCGGVLHDRELIIPYAMSDYASTFATVSLDEVLEAMVRV
jgi:predicted GH43/DUF377 family glycosyl hydrolase